MCKVYTGYCGTSEIAHDLCVCTVDNPLSKARGLSLRTGAQTILCTNHPLSLTCSMANGISFDVSFSLNCTDLYKRGGGA